MSEARQTTPISTETPAAAVPGSIATEGTAAAAGQVTEPASLVNESAATAADPFDAEKLTLPEGFEKTEQYTEFTNIAKELGLSQPNAQKLIDLHAAVNKAAVENLSAGWQKQNDEWVAEVKADPEIGGAKLDEVRQTISKLLDNPELTDPKFRAALDFTGAGNNPAVIRTLSRWAKALSEGSAVAGGPAARNPDGSVAQTRPSIAGAIYGADGPHSGGPKL